MSAGSSARLTIAAALMLPCLAAAEERPDGFVDAAAVVPGLVVEMRYYGYDNFTGAPVEGYEAPRSAFCPGPPARRWPACKRTFAASASD